MDGLCCLGKTDSHHEAIKTAPKPAVQLVQPDISTTKQVTVAISAPKTKSTRLLAQNISNL
jgi:hypothetical protein